MDDLVDLDEMLCFAMYNASRALTARYRELLTPLGLTYPQYLVLLTLWNESPLAIGELGQRLYLDSGTLSPLLKRLQSLGFIDRARSGDDERVVLVSLTDSGREIRQQLADVPEIICEATGLSREAVSDLRAQVEAVASHVRATAHSTPHTTTP